MSSDTAVAVAVVRVNLRRTPGRLPRGLLGQGGGEGIADNCCREQTGPFGQMASSTRMMVNVCEFPGANNAVGPESKPPNQHSLFFYFFIAF